MDDSPAITLLRAAIAVPLFDARGLPALGERILAGGFDGPAVLRLVLTGMEVTDPRDVRLAAADVADELGLAPMSDDEVGVVVLAVFSILSLINAMPDRTITALADTFNIATGHRASGAITELGYMDSWWDASSSPTAIEELEFRVAAIVGMAPTLGLEDLGAEVLEGLIPLRRE